MSFEKPFSTTPGRRRRWQDVGQKGSFLRDFACCRHSLHLEHPRRRRQPDQAAPKWVRFWLFQEVERPEPNFSALCPFRSRELSIHPAVPFFHEPG